MAERKWEKPRSQTPQEDGGGDSNGDWSFEAGMDASLDRHNSSLTLSPTQLPVRQS